MTAFAATASTITLDTTSLPSTQGWDYQTYGSHDGAVETDIFSTDGSAHWSDPASWFSNIRWSRIGKGF